jgi:beta-lactamase regulating signal transducer with metallopeptidase domain
MTRRKKIVVRDRKLGRENVFGQAWSDGLIELDSRMTPRRRLTILIHEVLHIAQPKMSESAVERTAALIGKHVWKDGYRRTYPKPSRGTTKSK